MRRNPNWIDFEAEFSPVGTRAAVNAVTLAMLNNLLLLNPNLNPAHGVAYIPAGTLLYPDGLQTMPLVSEIQVNVADTPEPSRLGLIEGGVLVRAVAQSASAAIFSRLASYQARVST